MTKANFKKNTPYKGPAKAVAKAKAVKTKIARKKLFPTSIGGSFATDSDIDTMTYIMAHRRPERGATEAKFIEDLIVPNVEQSDAYGNYMVRIGTAPILWSSHIDTVHSKEGFQHIMVTDGMMHLPNNTKSSCLGADCGAGIWLMLEMISAGVEGLYIFHRDEESGRNGANWIARNTPGVLEGIQFAIAFDRYGTDSIITHQMGTRCCSEDFSESLSEALGMNHTSDSGGSYTDTASYVSLVPECTNLSVGYYDQHSSFESQDIQYLALLRDRLCSADFSKLVATRDHTARDFDLFDDDLWNFSPSAKYGTPSDADILDMTDLIAENPKIAAILMSNYMGWNAYELADAIQDEGGTVTTFYNLGKGY